MTWDYKFHFQGIIFSYYSTLYCANNFVNLNQQELMSQYH